MAKKINPLTREEVERKFWDACPEDKTPLSEPLVIEVYVCGLKKKLLIKSKEVLRFILANQNPMKLREIKSKYALNFEGIGSGIVLH